MASITTFARLEPQPRRGDVTVGSAAPIRDPLWLLARQWQVGEFAGHDGGSPIVARWRGVAAAPTRLVAGPILPNTAVDAPGFDPAAAPLESIIERVTAPLPIDADTSDGIRLAVDTGRHFLALLGRQVTSRDYRGDFLARYLLAMPSDEQLAALDPATAAFARLHAERSLDGRLLRAELADHDVPRLGSAIEPGDVAEVRQAAAAWLAWLATLFDDADPDTLCWQPTRFEYTASMAGRRSADPFGETTLTAPRYDRDTIDWYEFDVNGEVNLGTRPAEAGLTATRTVVPSAVTAPGLPAARFWEFEDGRLNIAAIRPANTDLAQVLLVETLSAYGNDWYVIGIELPVGRIVESASLVVTDTFGVRTLLRPAGATTSGRWGLFRHAMPVEDDEAEGVPISNLLYLAPAGGATADRAGRRADHADARRAGERRLGDRADRRVADADRRDAERCPARRPAGRPRRGARLPTRPRATTALDPATAGADRAGRAGRARARVGARRDGRPSARRERHRAARGRR